MRRKADTDKLGLFVFQLLEFRRELEKIVVRGPVVCRKLGLLKDDPAKPNGLSRVHAGVPHPSTIAKTCHARTCTFHCSVDRRRENVIVRKLRTKPVEF